MKLVLLAALAVLVASQLVSAACHNATGSCTEQHFVCANEELIGHHKRCDGVEDCADGTDEYLCDQRADKAVFDLKESERNAVVEASCIYCTCWKSLITVTTASVPWWKIAVTAPRDVTLMTDFAASPVFNRACNPTCATSITLNVYKKKNKGCRGWICCFRQQACTVCNTGAGCLTATTAKHCYN